MPAANIPNSSPGGGGSLWYNALEPYLGGAELALTSLARPLSWQKCPAKELPIQGDYNAIVGYGWNYSYFGHDNYNAPGQLNAGAFSRMAQVAHPARTIIAGDSTDATVAGLAPGITVHRYLYPPIWGSMMTTYTARRHSGCGNYLFLDGHVQSFTPEQLFQDAQDNPGKGLFVRDK